MWHQMLKDAWQGLYSQKEGSQDEVVQWCDAIISHFGRLPFNL
jgi:hypothetical protein